MTFLFEARARSTDPQTSWDAARSIDPRDSHDAVLEVLERHPEGLTDFELEEALAGRFSPSRIRTARSELATPKEEAPARVEYMGFDRLTRSGRRARVWGVPLALFSVDS